MRRYMRSIDEGLTGNAATVKSSAPAACVSSA